MTLEPSDDKMSYGSTYTFYFVEKKASLKEMMIFLKVVYLDDRNQYYLYAPFSLCFTPK